MSNSPLEKRYQVFVSSTFEDLKEERKHAIQALLESKCIPAGMELFPAASTEQWTLIRRIIDESDYYVLILAGRYGSIGLEGLSYTEMEFDYAVKRKKPVLSFYHADIMSLPGHKLERTDKGREALENFTKKVKMRMCKPWTTGDSLASAIKSAIFHQIEVDPQPGWVRAAAVDRKKSNKSEGLSGFREDKSIRVIFEVEIKSLRPLSFNSYKYDVHTESVESQLNWEELFGWVARRLKGEKKKADVSGFVKQEAMILSGIDFQSMAAEGFRIASIRLKKECVRIFFDRLLSKKFIVEKNEVNNEGWRSGIITKIKLTREGASFAARLRSENGDGAELTPRLRAR